MANSDWTVEHTRNVPFINRNPNPYTGIAIDPDGITMTRFELLFTHLPTGKQLFRSDAAVVVNEAMLLDYAEGVITNAERNLAQQAAQPFGALNVFPVVEPPVEVPPTKEELQQQKFKAAAILYTQLKTFVDQGDLAVDDPVFVKAQQVRAEALAPVLDDIKAKVDDGIDNLPAVAEAAAIDG